MTSFFSPRCGTTNVDLVAAAYRQRFRQQRPILDRVRQQDRARARLVVIELREKFTEHFAGRERTIRLRKIGAVAPVLSGAKEKHLDAGVAAALMRREHVRLVDAAQVDALLRLDRRQRGKPVAQYRRTFEVERVRRGIHFRRELILHDPALAGEKARAPRAPVRHSRLCEISPVQGAAQRLI